MERWVQTEGGLGLGVSCGVVLVWQDRVNGLQGCRVLGLWPAAGSGYSLDAVTRYKLSELAKWTSPAGK